MSIIKIFFVYLYCSTYFLRASDAQIIKSLGFFYFLKIEITDIGGVVPPFVSCNDLQARESVLNNGKGDTVFLLPIIKSSTHMKNSAKENLSVFEYEGKKITFRTSEGALMVNATEMAKPFEKSPNHFLRNQETQDYILALSQIANSQPDQIYFVKNGGKDNGTWFCELLAIRFAQWLSPQFSVWVDVHIKELLTKGKTTIQPSEIPQKYKGTKWETQTITFTVERYSCALECTPDKWLPEEFLRAVKNTVDKMCFVLQN